jgi:dolichyl-phosphate-mannose-protein mannosyltransferase
LSPLIVQAEQQITLYPHRDTNNDWLLINGTDQGHPETDWMDKPLTYITPGMRIKLQHVVSQKHLHSHDYRPPVSDVDFQNEVSGYGQPGFVGDANDYWIVEIEKGDKKDRESSKRLRTLKTHFKLRHELTGCYLFSHKVKLPEWGFEQQEVTCNKNAVRKNSLWFIETASHVKREFLSCGLQVRLTEIEQFRPMLPRSITNCPDFGPSSSS